MAIVSLLSAKGSPGVTTTALLAAALWPRDVLLLDADPAGGDVSVRVPAADGGLLDPERGLLPLLTSARRGLGGRDVLAQAQPVAGGTAVVCGLTAPEQAVAAARTWPTLATAVADLSRGTGSSPATDVVVDAGRLDAQPVHLPLLRESAVVVLVLRDDVSGVLHARERLRTLTAALHRGDGAPPRVGVLVVADARRPDAGAAAELVRAAGERVEDFGRLPLDVRGARVFDGARHARPERTALVRAGRLVVMALAAAAHESGSRAA